MDALTEQLSAQETSTLVLVQLFRADHYFPRALQQRLDALMTRWRAARDQGASLSAQDHAELEALADGPRSIVRFRYRVLPLLADHGVGSGSTISMRRTSGP